MGVYTTGNTYAIKSRRFKRDRKAKRIFFAGLMTGRPCVSISCAVTDIYVLLASIIFPELYGD